MKKLFGYSFLVFIVAGFGCNEEVSGPVEMDSFNDSLSYSYGVQIAESLKNLDDDSIDIGIVSKALAEAFNGNAQLTLQQCQELMMAMNTTTSFLCKN